MKELIDSGVWKFFLMCGIVLLGLGLAMYSGLDDDDYV